MAPNQPSEAEMQQFLRQLQQQQAMQQSMPQQEKKEEEEDLEEKVESGAWQTFKNLAYLGTTLAAAAYLGGSLMFVDGVALAGGFMGGKILQKIVKKETTTYADVLKDGIVGGVMGMFLNTAFEYFAPATTLAKFLFIYPLNTVFMPMQYTLDHIIRKYNPATFVKGLVTKPVEIMSELYDDVKQKLDETYWKVTKYMGPLFGATAAFVPRYLMTPVMAILDVVYAAFTVGEKDKKDDNVAHEHKTMPMRKAA